MEEAVGRVALAMVLPFSPAHSGCASWCWTSWHEGEQPCLWDTSAVWFEWFLGTKLHIAFALYPVLSVGSNLHCRQCWRCCRSWSTRGPAGSWGYRCGVYSVQAGKPPKTGESTELNISVQHFSPPDLMLFFWQRVLSGVNPAERICLSWWLGGDTSGSGHSLPAHTAWHTGHSCPLGLLTRLKKYVILDLFPGTFCHQKCSVLADFGSQLKY